jgi:phage repressor protein C with HTH and peptisase S24 domain
MLNKNLIKAVDDLELKHPVSQIAKDLSTSKGTVSSYYNGNIKASDAFLEKFANFYKVSLEILKDNKEENILITENKGVVIYDTYFSAGFVEMFKDGNPTVLGHLNIPEVKGADFVIRAKGDSMLGVINDSDWVGIKRITDLEVINYGNPYAIVTQDLQMLKYIYKSTVADNFLLKSENENHPEFDLPIKKILELYIITVVLPFSKIKTYM